MVEYIAKIICDECGSTETIKTAWKAALPSLKELKESAREEGWRINGEKHICKFCKNNTRRPKGNE